MISPTTTVAPTTPAPAAAPAAPPESDVSDFLHNLFEIVNPLQHIPVVSTLYRNLTGDKINTFDRIAGDTLYGGMLGFAGSVADTIFEKVTGKDFGDTVFAFITGNGDQGVANAKDPNAPMKVAAYSQLTPRDLSSIDLSAADADADVAGKSDPTAPLKIAAYSQLMPSDLSSIDVSGTDAAPTAQAGSSAPRRLGTVSTMATPELSALEASMLKAQINPAIAGRAAYAYQRAVGLSPVALGESANPPLN